MAAATLRSLSLPALKDRRAQVLYNRRALGIVASLTQPDSNEASHSSTPSNIDSSAPDLRPSSGTGEQVRVGSSILQRDPEVVLETLRVTSNSQKKFGATRYATGEALKYAAKELRSDGDFVLKAVKVNGLALEHASSELQMDKEIVTAAVAQNGLALEYVADRLRADQQVVCTAVVQNPAAYRYRGQELAHCHRVRIFADRSGMVSDDINFMLEAVASQPCLLQFASRRLRENESVVYEAVSQDGMVLEHAANELKRHKGIVGQAVRQNGFALQHAVPDLRDEFSIVWAAINQNGLALQFASDRRRADREIVQRALLHDGHALQFACEPLRSDRAVVHAALKQNIAAWIHVPSELRKQPGFLSKRMRREIRARRSLPSVRGSTFGDESRCSTAPQGIASPLALGDLGALFKMPKWN